MSLFRKTVLTTAIIGAGLASTAGAAFAGDCPESGKHHGEHEKSHSASQNGGCLNAVDADNSSGVGDVAMGAVFGGSQFVTPTNLCNNLNGNSFLNGNNVSLLGNVHNGDETTKTAAATEGDDSPATVAPAPSFTETPIQP